MITNTEDKILKLLETLVEGQESLTKEVQDVKQVQTQTNTRLDRIEQSQAQTNATVTHLVTAIKALPTKQDLEASENRLNDKIEATVEVAKAEIQATMIDQIAKLTRILHKYKVRLEHLEKHTETTDPTQN